MKRILLLVKRKPKDAVLLIIGDGPDRDQIINVDNGRDIRVICQVVKPEELRPYYKAADLFVSASNFETNGMACHEALVCQTPVVVEDAQGYTSQVYSGDDGYLTKFEDSIGSMLTIENALQSVSGVNFVEMIISTKIKGSFWVSQIFKRLVDTFLNPSILLSL